MAETRPSGKLILIVDDDPGVVDVFDQAVRLEGFQTAVASSGPEALKKASELKPALMILDLMLPGYDGFWVIRQLRASPRAAMPIIVVTGRFTDTNTTSEVCREPNIVGFLTKPVERKELAAMVHNSLGTTRPS